MLLVELLKRPELRGLVILLMTSSHGNVELFYSYRYTIKDQYLEF